MTAIKISTDGAQVPGSSVGGWGVVIRSEDNYETLSGSERDTTNNRMELRAILEGLKKMPDDAKVLVRSDSEYALKVSQGIWNASKNLDLVKDIRSETDRLNVEWTWIEGHIGDEDNETADDLAKQCAQEKIDKIADDGAPFIIRGKTRPVKNELKNCGMSWVYNEKLFWSWHRKPWLYAVQEVGAEIKSESEAII